jgi:hypothetical protein
MMERFGQPKLCENMNHRRAKAPVAHCSQCGDVVNEDIRTQPCSESQHAAARRRQIAYCVHCGTRLILALK